MKYLQITYKNQPVEPKILEMGVDFFSVQQHSSFDIKQEFAGIEDYNGDNICLLSDTYQSRPLIEIDGFCEFDIFMINEKENNMVLCLFDTFFKSFLFGGFRFDNRCKFTNLGSVFTPENKEKYFILYAQALEIARNTYAQALEIMGYSK